MVASSDPLPVLRPDWHAPAGVSGLVSTREGGVSQGAWASLNVSMAVGDDALAVAENRRRVVHALGAPIVWMNLVHGARVARVGHADLSRPRPVADAAWTDEAGVACAVTAADCLPVLFCTTDGRAVAVAHAGWRGLAAGVLENTVAALVTGTGCSPGDVQAWLGPCIGAEAFEVGGDVLEAFACHGHPAERFVARPRPDGQTRWLADLPNLARDRLRAAGVGRLSGRAPCTVSDASRYFSYRRDRVSGRMVAAIWRR
jgi:polyphenol oxidase